MMRGVRWARQIWWVGKSCREILHVVHGREQFEAYHLEDRYRTPSRTNDLYCLQGCELYPIGAKAVPDRRPSWPSAAFY